MTMGLKSSFWLYFPNTSALTPPLEVLEPFFYGFPFFILCSNFFFSFSLMLEDEKDLTDDGSFSPKIILTNTD